MASRTAIVYLLTAILLACPYFCLSNSVAGTGTSSTRSSNSGGCNCCPHPVPQDSNDRPSQPDPRQGNGTCLCHGAVVNPHVEMPNPEQGIVAYLSLDSMLLFREPFAVQRGSLSESAACHFPIADSGREVRALIESLLL